MVCFRYKIVNTLHKCDNKDNNININNNTCRGGDMEVKPDSEINAAPNQVLRTKYNATKI
jgi:hypothetical protein